MELPEGLQDEVRIRSKMEKYLIKSLSEDEKALAEAFSILKLMYFLHPKGAQALHAALGIYMIDNKEKLGKDLSRTEEGL